MGEDVLAGINWGIVTPVMALVGLLVWMVRTVAKGKLVPESLYQEVTRDRDRWRKVSELDGDTLRQMSRQIDGLVEASELVVTVIRILQADHDREEKKEHAQETKRLGG